MDSKEIQQASQMNYNKFLMTLVNKAPVKEFNPNPHKVIPTESFGVKIEKRMKRRDINEKQGRV